MTSGLKKKITFAVIAVFAAAAVFIFMTRSRSTSERKDRVSWQDLDKMLSAGDFDGPIALLDAHLKNQPNDGLLRYFKARVLYEKGDTFKALAETEKALILGFPQGSAWLLKGVIYGGKLGDYKKQAEYASKALFDDPSDEEAYLIRAEARAVLKDHTGAARDLTSYLAFNPKDAFAYINRAGAFYELADYPAALADAGKALSLDPKKDYAHFIAGRSLAARKDFKGAIARFTSAIELSPERSAYYVQRAEAYEKLNDFYDAAWDYSTAMAAPEVHCCASYYYLLGANMYRINEVQAALKAAGEALRRGGETPAFLELRGRILAQAGRPKEAARDFKRMAELEPGRGPDAEKYLRRLGKDGKK
ncbi:MAG: tetratricopeptide repeat protein [Elusimicrobia bacterium]|nr:tetratricopeptide repeat protein [Elusimicrobiota bacterium]